MERRGRRVRRDETMRYIDGDTQRRTEEEGGSRPQAKEGRQQDESANKLCIRLKRIRME